MRSALLRLFDRLVVRIAQGPHYLRLQDAAAEHLKADPEVAAARDLVDAIYEARVDWSDTENGLILRIAIDAEHGSDTSSAEMDDWTVAISAAHERFKRACRESLRSFHASAVTTLGPHGAADLPEILGALEKGIDNQSLDAFLQIRAVALSKEVSS